MTETWTLKHDAVLPFGGQYGGIVHVRAYEAGDDAPPVVIFGEFSDHDGTRGGQAATQYAAAAQSNLYLDGRELRFVLHRTTPFGSDRSYPRFEEVVFHRRYKRYRRSFRQWLLRLPYQPDVPTEPSIRPPGRTLGATVLNEEGAKRFVLPTPAVDLLPWGFEHYSWRGGEQRIVWPDSEMGALVSAPPCLIRPAQVQLPDLLGDTLVDVWPPDFYTAEFIGGAAAAEQLAKARARNQEQDDNLCGFGDAIAAPQPGTIVTGPHPARDEGDWDDEPTKR